MICFVNYDNFNREIRITYLDDGKVKVEHYYYSEFDSQPMHVDGSDKVYSNFIEAWLEVGKQVIK